MVKFIRGGRLRNRNGCRHIHIVEINGWKRRKAWNSERRQAASFTSAPRFGSRGNPVKEAIGVALESRLAEIDCV